MALNYHQEGDVLDYTNTITQEIAKGNLNFYTTAAKNVFYSSLLGTIVSLVLSGYYLFNQNYTLGLGLLLIGLATPFLNKYLLATSFFFGQKEFKQNAKLVLIPDIISAIFLVIVSYFNSSALVLLFTYLTTNLIGNLIIHRKITSKLSTDTNTEKFSLWNLLKNFDKDSIHYSAMNMIAVVGINLDKLLIFTVIGSKELAIFFFAQAIPLQARGMLRIIHNLTFPKFIDKEINFYKVNRSILGLLLFGLLGVVSYILVAPVLFSLLFPQYLSSVYLTQLYSLSIIVYPAIYLMSGILLAKNTTLYLYKISIYNTIGNAMLLLVAANISSLQGVVYAVIASSILYFTLFYYYFYKTSTTS
jgi:O-antigen/teichoic acid export membrane protein